MSERTRTGKPRYVLDTNVLISAALSADSTPGRALMAALQRGTVVVSRSTAQELAEVLSRPKFDRYVTADERSRFLAALLRQSELVEVVLEVKACRDPKDDKFLSLAVAASATAIISGDADLLVLDPFQEVRIIPPQTFLAHVPI